MSSEQLERVHPNDEDLTQELERPSLKVPEMVPPRLSTPVIDKSPLGDFLFSSFTQPPEDISGKLAEVEKLSQESNQLDQQLKELSKRLEAAEQRRRSLVAARESREKPIHVHSERAVVNAGGS
ncbi:hypothetical protein FRC03_009481 [Tulasnella sp. 419]|nr:hypothetical protein FRC03_009481 [Tulasnella sp. 419]